MNKWIEKNRNIIEKNIDNKRKRIAPCCFFSLFQTGRGGRVLFKSHYYSWRKISGAHDGLENLIRGTLRRANDRIPLPL